MFWDLHFLEREVPDTLDFGNHIEDQTTYYKRIYVTIAQHVFVWKDAGDSLSLLCSQLLCPKVTFQAKKPGVYGPESRYLMYKIYFGPVAF